MSPSVVTHFDVLRPCDVRLLARRNGKRITTAEIARRAKLSIPTVNLYAKARSWKGIKIGQAERFARACGHDLLRPRRNLQYLMRFIKTGRGLAHLTKRERIRFSKILTED